MTFCFKHLCDLTFETPVYICRWLQQSGSVACMQHAVHCSACDRHRVQSFRNLVVICDSQQSPAIPKRFSLTSFVDVRWHSYLSSGAAPSQSTRKHGYIDNLYRSRNSFQNTAMLRLLHTSPIGQREPESKVEETLEALKDSVKKESVKKTAATEPGDTVVTEAKIPPKVTEVEDLHPPAVPEAVPSEKKKSLWVRFKTEMVHYYHGFRLLFIDTRVAIRLIWHVLNGQPLMRRERKQVIFILADVVTEQKCIV